MRRSGDLSYLGSGGCGATLPSAYGPGAPCTTATQCSRCTEMSGWQHDGWLFRHGHSRNTPSFVIAESWRAMRDADHAAAIQLEQNYARHGMKP